MALGCTWPAMQLKTEELQLNLLGLPFLLQGSSHEVSLTAMAVHLPVAVLSSQSGLLDDSSPELLAFSMSLFTVWICLSMKPLLHGWFGDDVVCLIPRPVRYELNSLPLKGGTIVTHDLIGNAFYTGTALLGGPSGWQNSWS